MMRQRGRQDSALQFYWYEIKPNEVMRATWGQFVGAIHRILDIDEELSDALRQREIRKRMHRMTRIIESYLHRAYELRERMVNLLALVSGDTAAASASKNPKKRERALGKLRGSHPELVAGVSRLLILLDADMLLRNMHTHECFLSLGLVASNGPYDPDDVLTDLEHRPDDHRAMTSLLRTETRRLADEYRARIRSVRDAAFAIMETADMARL
ncbi:MAG: hypothetical protein ACYC26_16680 [Phycisphaerales bacterium]